MKTSFLRGFSLVELMITLGIAAIIMSMAVPTFKTFIDKQRLLTTASEFYSAVNMTRAEAIKRGSRVNMVATDGTNWTSGWTVFIDANSNLKVDAGETIIFSHDATNLTSTSIGITNNFTDSASTYISYTGNGRSRTDASSQQPQAGTVTFTLGTSVRRVKINFLGRSRICDPSVDLNTCGDTQTGD